METMTSVFAVEERIDRLEGQPLETKDCIHTATGVGMQHRLREIAAIVDHDIVAFQNLEVT